MEYVWIGGASGAGKARLIRKALEGDAKLRERFALVGSVAVYEPSLDPKHSIPFVLSDLIKLEVDHVLIKWQYAWDRQIEELCLAQPSQGYRAILLMRPYETRVADLRLRDQGIRTWSDEVCSNDERSALERFESLKAAGYQVEIVDASLPDYPGRADFL